MNVSIKDYFRKRHQIRGADMITFTQEILNGKLHFLWSAGTLRAETFAGRNFRVSKNREIYGINFRVSRFLEQISWKKLSRMSKKNKIYF